VSPASTLKVLNQEQHRVHDGHKCSEQTHYLPQSSKLLCVAHELYFFKFALAVEEVQQTAKYPEYGDNSEAFKSPVYDLSVFVVLAN
jgi:hypothetical protein